MFQIFTPSKSIHYCLSEHTVKVQQLSVRYGVLSQDIFVERNYKKDQLLNTYSYIFLQIYSQWSGCGRKLGCTAQARGQKKGGGCWVQEGSGFEKVS